MRLRKYIEEETITTDVEVGADAATSNKLIKVELRDEKIKSLVNKLKKKKDITVTIEPTRGKYANAIIDMPFHAPKSVMNQLSSYTV